jgi:hypothetical protein
MSNYHDRREQQQREEKNWEVIWEEPKTVVDLLAQKALDTIRHQLSVLAAMRRPLQNHVMIRRTVDAELQALESRPEG